MIIVLKILFWFITGYYIFCSLYVFIFSIAGLFYKNPVFKKALIHRKIAILVPAYKADKVIEDLAQNVLSQDYPHYELIIIADSIADSVVDRLKQLPVKVMEFTSDNRTKALALNTIMAQLPDDYYDIALVLDSDNLLQNRDYLYRLNDAFDAGLRFVQTHRTAKNINTQLAVLDAVSEEINNTLFRRGHAAIGLSSSLIGSAMAFDYHLFKEQMKHITSTGEDKELEMQLLKNGFRIEYLDDLVVLDEKTQHSKSFITQRARWIANQIMQARENLGEGFVQLFRGNFDFFDKVMQHLMVPRIILLASVFFLSFLSVIFLNGTYLYVWLAIVSIVSISLLLSIPKRFYTVRLLKAVVFLPKVVILMFLSLFKMKGATKKFNATEHVAVPYENLIIGTDENWN